MSFNRDAILEKLPKSASYTFDTKTKANKSAEDVEIPVQSSLQVNFSEDEIQPFEKRFENGYNIFTDEFGYKNIIPVQFHQL